MIILIAAAISLQAATSASAAGSADANGIKIEIPVDLKDAKVVFNLDHPAFEGDEPTGLNFMRLMIARFRADHTNAQIVAIFHGDIGYICSTTRSITRPHWWGGNVRGQIAA